MKTQSEEATAEEAVLFQELSRKMASLSQCIEENATTYAKELERARRVFRKTFIRTFKTGNFIYSYLRFENSRAIKAMRANAKAFENTTNQAKELLRAVQQYELNAHSTFAAESVRSASRLASAEKELRTAEARPGTFLNFLAKLSLVMIFVSCFLVTVGYRPQPFWAENLKNPMVLPLFSTGMGLLVFLSFSIANYGIAIRPLRKTVYQERYLLASSSSLGGSAQARTERLFKQHQEFISRFYTQNLHTSTLVLVFALCTILLGFASIGIVFYQYQSHLGAGPETKTTITEILNALSGILTVLIGGAAIKMYADTIQSNSTFHARLAKTHHAHFAALLLAEIDDDAKKNDGLIEVSKQLLINAEANAGKGA